MKKSLLIAAALVASAAFTAQADQMVFGYCSDVVADNIGGASANTYISGAIEIPADKAANWKGNKITSINVGFGDSRSREITLFITDELANTPFYEQKAIAQKKNEWNEYKLDTPYEFTGDKIYVGYYLRVASSSDYPIGIDEQTEQFSDYGDYIATGSSKGRMRENYGHFGERFGNVSLRLVIEGDNLPANDATIANMTHPVVLSPTKPFNISVLVYNQGVAAINDFDVKVAYGDKAEESRHFVCETAIAPGTSQYFTVEGLQYTEEFLQMPVTVSIPKVNGADNASAAGTRTFTADCSDNIFQRKIVIEEGTGTWCGNCPRGIVGMHEMEQKYPDSFIGIATHSSDNFVCQAYTPVHSFFGGNYPMAVVNRNLTIDPSFSHMEGAYNELNTPAYIKVDVNARYNEDHSAIIASASTTFSQDFDNVDYRIAFVITEDGLPAMQANNYADGKLGEMGGFENLPEMAPIMLDHVARYINNWQGAPESAISSAARGDVKYYEEEISLDPKNVTIANIKNIHIIAMLVDNTIATREIYTADRKSAEETILGGVTDIIADSDPDAPVEYYNLQGIRVAEPAAGNVYIRRQGDRATKIIY